MTPATVLVLAVAIGVTAVSSYLVLRLARHYGLAPQLRERDVHRVPTPRLGGVAMFIGLLAAFGVAATQPEFRPLFNGDMKIWALIGACLLIAVIGVLDDVLDLDWMIKLGAQLLAAGVLAWNGVQIVSLPLGDTLVIGSPIVNFVLTVFLMTLVMNAVNFVDGLDGLVAGVAIIASATFYVYTLVLTSQMGHVVSVTFSSLIALVLVGICLGFLPFNWHRAKMFMGDTGALLVGLLMATSTVSVTGEVNPAALDIQLVLASYIPIILPVAVLALPLADFSLAVLRRVRAGKSPFEADRRHLHHRLLDMGHSPIQAVLFFYLGTAVLSVAGLLVFIMRDFTIPLLVLTVGGVVALCVLFFPVSRIRAAWAQKSLVPLKPFRNPQRVSAVELDPHPTVALPNREDSE
ncbi:MraY family glycosyltransferase [Leucobacter denitrificans]|uniref:Undecaprenyl/decaprenyl-phosphate alpha-N-acetylglucosaminyl 1-phosphate transferase n=1 Tax=Leucobacter denitrificans TaxID=683042 RepID=A0A7G9S4G9_9MICO|nr:MraY family glycosyltransferase [Leucobacter denitrificans]QNN62744.1 undecaprenyl/decaprenyl-phosphate alpha-N-acetylglucosaminyl 1-phosphate transferase [Leucobacter denitrificans]